MSVPARIRLYGRLLLDVLQTKRRYVLGGSTVPKVADIQQQALPRTIYDGPVCIDGVDHQGRVYYGTRWTILSGFVVGAIKRLRREAGRSE